MLGQNRSSVVAGKPVEIGTRDFTRKILSTKPYGVLSEQADQGAIGMVNAFHEGAELDELFHDAPLPFPRALTRSLNSLISSLMGACDDVRIQELDFQAPASDF